MWLPALSQALPGGGARGWKYTASSSATLLPSLCNCSSVLPMICQRVALVNASIGAPPSSCRVAETSSAPSALRSSSRSPSICATAVPGSAFRKAASSSIAFSGRAHILRVAATLPMVTFSPSAE
jgi:hypothetical protein